MMERRSSSDSERTISDNERVGSSERSKRKRKQEEGTTSTGFGSGSAGKRHLRFSVTATTHIDIDLESLNVEQQQREVRNQAQPDKAHDQAGPRKPGREVRLFGVDIADGPGRQQQEASSSRQLFGWQEQRQKEVIDISTDSDNESNHENEILKEKKGEIVEIIDSILNAPYKSRVYFKDIKSKIDGKLESSEDVEIAQNYLEDTWNKYSRRKKVSTSVRRNNLLKLFKAVKTRNSER